MASAVDELTGSMISPPSEFVATNACTDSGALVSSGPEDSLLPAKWDRDVIAVLMAWARNPFALVDEGVEPPSHKALIAALIVAQWFKERREETPDRIVPDPNGGIVFERRVGEIIEVIHIWNDLPIEYMRFEETKLVKRRRL